MKTLTFSDKPTRRVVNARTPHGVRPQIVVTVYPNATIGLRELGRRKEYCLDAGALYVSAVIREVSKAKADRKKRGRK